jgi:hypothetical protein
MHLLRKLSWQPLSQVLQVLQVLQLEPQLEQVGA